MNERKMFEPKPVPPALLAAARSLRSSMTDAEKLLWQCLRKKQPGGFRFRRQHPVEQYVVDFYCVEVKVAIEVDGGHHNLLERKTADRERTEFLGNQGIRVIRFWNSEVLSNPESVVEEIYRVLQEQTAGRIPLPCPPPSEEGVGTPQTP